MHNPESVLENRTHICVWDFEIQTDYLISARRPDLAINNKEKRACLIQDFAVSADHSVKSKESKKKDKYLDLGSELKKKKKKPKKTPNKLRNMKVAVIPIVIDGLGTGLVQGQGDLEIRGRVDTIKTTA